MRRDILRFPVGQEFKDMLNDYYEWLILTDLKLKPLITYSGGRGSISGLIVRNAYIALTRKAKGKTLYVYELHTHPDCKTPTPSTSDISCFVTEADDSQNKRRGTLKSTEETTQYHHPNIIVMGRGVITKNGITIVKLPWKRKKLQEAGYTFDWEYAGKSKRLEESGVYTEERNVQDQKHSKLFRSTVKKYPEIKIKTVRSQHRFNMRRRR